MLKSLLPVAALAGFAVPAHSQAADPIEVMVLGTYHMGNPGRDLVNVRADDVTAPKRQAELQAVADAIAAWKPTKVLVEAERPAPFTMASYRAFTPDMLKTNPNEVYQIGYRIALEMHHLDVYGFDEQGGEGEPDYFPYGKVEDYAKAHGQMPLLDQQIGFFKNQAAQQEKVQATLSIADLLALHNNPERIKADHRRGYYALLAIGDAEQQPGAELNAYWYMRNAKMFAKIGLIGKPGDRLLVLVGAGHAYWLRHFAESTPGYRLVDPLPYLAKAAATAK
ncbi:DUF5694 domain-containing protein [Sphingomonas hankyongi]|uniref:DUF5694 domain-containing protein n=1 Tax=Sphingomonas hankyongi TaxID=2908209 RepID=A0ABT0S496_9SPHN|nr:DUF5694 domain-containing protein [Sphingomonas hankyongi]MCL6730695.1 DUF5694 domain-containing protein [Sphingomonas hankyongi]